MSQIVSQCKPPPTKLVRSWAPQDLEQRLLELRKEWGIQEPQYGLVPRWLRRRVYDAIRAGKLPLSRTAGMDGWDCLQHAGRHLGNEWIDHVGRLTLGRRLQVLTTEPYGPTSRAVSQLMHFCTVTGLHWRIQGESWWFPGNTYRISVSEVPLG